MPTSEKNILLIRLSSLGDVALLYPVIQAAISQNPDVKFTLITRQFFGPMFEGLDVEIISPDLEGNHKGLFGVFKFYRELKSMKKWSAFLDLHDVLRSKVLGFLFRMNGVESFQIDKGRKEKRLLTQKKNKELRQLVHVTERYARVFKEAGFNLELPETIEKKATFSFPKNYEKEPSKKYKFRVGIAPFAKHKQKVYPSAQMKEVIRSLANKNVEVFLFGAGKEEKRKADILRMELPNVKNIIGKYSFSEELAIISNMDLMLCMDSASMHLSSMVGTKVISIWGATHPYAGFTGFGQKDPNSIIQVPENELDCRPCSVFGDKECFRGDLACMTLIGSKSVTNRILDTLSEEK